MSDKKQVALIAWLDNEIEIIEKHRKNLLKKESEARASGALSLASTYNRFAYGMQSRIQAFKDVKGREMSKEAEECSKGQVVDEFPDERCLHMTSVSLKYTRALFDAFREGCKHRSGVGCTHPEAQPEYHGCLAFVRPCKLENCPVVRDKCNDL